MWSAQAQLAPFLGGSRSFRSLGWKNDGRRTASPLHNPPSKFVGATRWVARSLFVTGHVRRSFASTRKGESFASALHTVS